MVVRNSGADPRDDNRLLAHRLLWLQAGTGLAAALVGCLEVAKQVPENEDAVLVTVFADSAAKYLSERFWEEEE